MTRSSSDCGRLMKEISDNMEKVANNALRQYDLTLTQFSALVLIREYPEEKMPLKKLEQLLHVSQPTVAGIVNRLAQKGLIEVIGDRDDKRVKYVFLTESGLDKCKSSSVQKEIMEHRVMDVLTEDEQVRFEEMLLKIWHQLMT